MTTTSELKGQTVLITGGRRVGAELALELAERGAKVAMTYRSSRQTIEETIAAIRERGGQGLALAADLSDPAQAARAVEETVQTLGGLAALVNMASAFRRTPFHDLTSGDFDDMIAANLAAPYHAAVAAARAMLEHYRIDGYQRKIVNIGDWASERPYKDYLPYLIAKGGLATMTLALARELAPAVAVSMVQPAMIDPPPEFSEQDKLAVLKQTPLERFGSAADVNRLVLYLLEGTHFVTGACFRVDGGRFLGADG